LFIFDLGGGKFISKDGSNHYPEIFSKIIDLPDDVLPSKEELKRDYEAITISEGEASSYE
jgi:hypothetical protein